MLKLYILSIIDFFLNNLIKNSVKYYDLLNAQTSNLCDLVEPKRFQKQVSIVL